MSSQDKSVSEGGCPLKEKPPFPGLALYDKIIIIEIGKEEFPIHKGLACYYSAFFRNILQGHVVDSHDVVYKLLPDEKESFKIFMSWMYTFKLHPQGREFSFKSDSKKIIHAYVFADRLGIPSMKNAIIDLLIELNCRERRFPAIDLRYAWECLPDGDGLRKLFFDWMSMNHITSKFFENPQLYPLDFAVALLDRVIRPDDRPAFRSTEEWLDAKCDYHDHTDGAIGGSSVGSGQEVKKERQGRVEEEDELWT